MTIFYLNTHLNLCIPPDIHEPPVLDDDDDFDPMLDPSVATTINTTSTAPSEHSSESCDTSPDALSPAASRGSEDISQGPVDTPTSDIQETAGLRDEGPDSAPVE